MIRRFFLASILFFYANSFAGNRVLIVYEGKDSPSNPARGDGLQLFHSSVILIFRNRLLQRMITKLENLVNSIIYSLPVFLTIVLRPTSFSMMPSISKGL